MIVESWSIGAFFLFISIRFLIFQYRLFPLHHSDGWRKTTEVHHRTEQAKYIGSLFNLAIRSKDTKDRKSFIDTVVGLLSEVFRETSETHFALAWKKFAVRRVENNYTDFVYVSYSENGAINEPELYPGKEYPLTFAQQPCLKEILLTVQDSFNMTKDLPDKKRPVILRKKILRRLAGNTPGGCSKDNKELVDRILAATWINFLEVGVGSMERNQPHWFFHQKNSGFGVFNVHCRHSSEFTWADLWVQFSHVGMDGRAAAKLQGRIKKKMGVFNNNMKFPQDFSIPENLIQFRFPGRNVFNGCGFVDFTDFINETNHLSVEHGKILPVALLIWNLARQPFFMGKKFNVPVDVPGNAQHDRTVGFVFTKPQYFTDTFSGEEAFSKYLHNFNNQVTGIRTRSGDNYLFLESSLMVPHWVLILMLRYMRSALYSLTGSICVTVIEGIEYGIPSLSDNVDSIISISLPVGADVISGCISIRSSTDNIKPIFDAVKNVVRNQVDPVNSLKQSSW